VDFEKGNRETDLCFEMIRSLSSSSSVTLSLKKCAIECCSSSRYYVNAREGSTVDIVIMQFIANSVVSLLLRKGACSWF